MAKTKSTGHRPTAEERREQVLAAAIEEFAEHGYHAARTAGIAQRAGISQPYVYALFENKKVLFLAVLDLVSDRIRDTFAQAWPSGADPAEGLRTLGLAYRELMADQNLLRCQLQGYAAASDPEIRDHIRALYIRDFDALKALTGLGDAAVARFRATGLLLNVGTVLDLPLPYSFAAPLD